MIDYWGHEELCYIEKFPWQGDLLWTRTVESNLGGKELQNPHLTVTSSYPPVSCMCLPFAEPNLNPEAKSVWFCDLHGLGFQGTEEGGKGGEWPWRGKSERSSTACDPDRPIGIILRTSAKATRKRHILFSGVPQRVGWETGAIDHLAPP